MPEIFARLGVLVLVSLLLWLIAWSGRRFVETRRQRVLAAEPPALLSSGSSIETISSPTPVRILSFSSEDCRQCHTLQAPALQRVLEARRASVSVLDIDATNSPELVESYQVLTVPTTIVLDATGHAHAVNYGFADTQRLLEQVDAILGHTAS